MKISTKRVHQERKTRMKRKDKDEESGSVEGPRGGRSSVYLDLGIIRLGSRF